VSAGRPGFGRDRAFRDERAVTANAVEREELERRLDALR
jgi:hypothetical protein